MIHNTYTHTHIQNSKIIPLKRYSLHLDYLIISKLIKTIISQSATKTHFHIFRHFMKCTENSVYIYITD